jgi:hypothetical protein
VLAAIPTLHRNHSFLLLKILFQILHSFGLPLLYLAQIWLYSFTLCNKITLSYKSKVANIIQLITYQLYFPLQLHQNFFPLTPLPVDGNTFQWNTLILYLLKTNAKQFMSRFIWGIAFILYYLKNICVTWITVF